MSLFAFLADALGAEQGEPLPASTLRAVRMRCENAADPSGIDTRQPRLSWQLQSSERGEKQTAYQILAASSPTVLAESGGDLWDSGKVASDETLFIPYSGKPLQSSLEVFWKVRVWDGHDRATEWSAPATWTMGLLAPKDWSAKWICAPNATETLLLRKEFNVRPQWKRAVIHVCGLGQYELTVNGTKASDDLLSPGWTDYDRTTLYDTLDITALLREGTNTIGFDLGNGMYNVVRRNRFAKFTRSFGPLRAIAQLELEYAAGSKQLVVTDTSWRTHAGPITFSSIYGGEDYDARLEPRGWEEPGFDDGAWPNAVAVVRPDDTLRGQSVAAVPLRAIETNLPVAVKKLSAAVSVYDFGQNASYMPRIRVSGPAGSTVRLIPAEAVNADGSIQRSTMGSTNRGISWWQFTKATNGEETWFPKFFYVGCRYFQAEFIRPTNPSPGPSATLSSSDGERDAVGGALPYLGSLEGVIVHSSAAPAGDFSCSNPLLNSIRDLVRWAQRANMVSVLTDCPHREKLGWLEQYHLNGPAIRYEFDVSRIFTKGMHDMADAQTADGLVPNIAPEFTEFKGTFRAAAEWGSAFIIVPWQQYQFDGDLDLLRTHYAGMKRYFAYLERRATNNLLSEGLGDWFDLGPKKPGAAQLTPPTVTATAFYFHDARILSQIAALLSRPDDAKNYSAKAEQIRAGYNRAFFNATNGTYATGSQCANALPLVFGMVEPRHHATVLDALVRDLESRDLALTAGDIGFRFLLQALAQNDRSDLVYRIINQMEKPGYGYMLKKGETSLCESWDANLTTSHNHFMLGQITEWFYKDLAGIDYDPARPGFKKIIIRPQPVGDLTWARASYHSIRGSIESAWERDGGKFTLKIKIPANTTATVFVPARDTDGVTESGKPATRSEAVRLLREEHGHAVFAVESGEYEFESK